MNRIFAALLFFCATCLVALRPASAVTIDWTPVGNPGNANDPATSFRFGAVGYSYNIGTYDVTNSQYVAFLNAKDPTGADPLGLHSSKMSDATYGGINFNAGNADGNKYSVISGNGNHPVNFVTWYSAVRFANWLNNGQGSGDTESGAYTLLHDGSPTPTPTPSNGESVMRNAGATVFLPSENEWYKAAFYNPANSTYFQYPTGSDTAPTGSSPTVLPNYANILPGGPNNLTDVGAYRGTMSPYGAFDMGGNVFQWNEAIFFGGGRGIRGGAFVFDSSYMTLRGSDFATDVQNYLGFRVASAAFVPEPGSLALAALGLAGLAAWCWRRHKHR